MPTRKSAPDAGRLDRIVAEARRAQAEREKGYREQAGGGKESQATYRPFENLGALLKRKPDGPDGV